MPRPNPTRARLIRALGIAWTAKLAGLSMVVSRSAAAAEVVRAMRIWPAAEYTRVTIESNNVLHYGLQTLRDPDRLVLDLENVDLANIQPDLNRFTDDPYIKSMRIGRFKPGVIRVVFDLRADVKPQAFALKPVGEYGHRLVLDIFPSQPVDPIAQLLEKRDEAHASPRNDPDSRNQGKAAPKDESRPDEESRADLRANPPRRDAGPVTRTMIVVLDPGHGGEDPGAVGRRGTYEKNVTLAIAKKMKALIDAEPNMRAVLTRDADYFVPLAARVDRARRARGDVFVSIHADAFIHPEARGSSVFALSERGATSVAAGWLAKRENNADLIGGVNLEGRDRHLAQTLFDLSQTATINDSLKLGRSVLTEVSGINRLHKNYVEQAGFAVLKAPDIPSILVETAFISNPDEEKKLADAAYQQRMARSLLKGIRIYMAKNPSQQRTTIAALGT